MEHFKSAEEQKAMGYEPLPNSGATHGQPSIMQDESSSSAAQDIQGGMGYDSGMSQTGSQMTSTGDTGFSQGGLEDTTSSSKGIGLSRGDFQDSSADHTQTGYQQPYSTSDVLSSGQADQSFSSGGPTSASGLSGSSEFGSDGQRSGMSGSDGATTSTSGGGRTSETGPSTSSGHNFGHGVSGATAEDTSGSGLNPRSGGQSSDFSSAGADDFSSGGGGMSGSSGERGGQRGFQDEGSTGGQYSQGGFQQSETAGQKTFGHLEEGGR